MGKVDLNPMGTKGFEFVEFTGPDAAALDRVFRLLGFTPIARHRSKDVTLYRQGSLSIALNAEAESFAERVLLQLRQPSLPRGRQTGQSAVLWPPVSGRQMTEPTGIGAVMALRDDGWHLGMFVWVPIDRMLEIAELGFVEASRASG